MTRRGSARRLFALAAAAALLPLAGCVDARADVIVRSDHDIRVSTQYFLLMPDETLLDACEPLVGELPAGVDWRRAYMLGSLYPLKGCRVDGTAVLDDLAAARHVRMAHDNGVYDLRIKIDSTKWTADTGPDYTDARMTVSVTFPGPILSSNGSGTVTGTTITWMEASDLASEDGLRVTARDAPGTGPLPLAAMAGALSVGLLGGMALSRWLLTRDGRASGPDDDSQWAPPGGDWRG